MIGRPGAEAIPSPELPRRPRSSLFRNARFRWFFVSEISGNLGYALYAVAIVWLAVGPSGNYALAGVVLALEFGIYALSFLIGPLVDRARNVRSVAVVGYALQAVLALLLGALASENALPVPVLLALVTALSVVWDFTWTATNALLPRIVAGEELFLANGLTGSASGGNQVIGAALGGLLIGLEGPGAAMLLYGAFNVVALATLIPLTVPDRAGAVAGLWSSFAGGWQYLTGGVGRPLVQLATFGALQGLVSAGPPLLIALEAQHGFANSAATYGVFATALALGSVVGGLLLGAANPRKWVGRFLVLTATGEGALFLGAAAVGPALAPAVAAWFAIGLAESIYYSAMLAYLQATTPAPLLGRTMTNSYLFRGAARSGGALVIGSVAGVVGFVHLATGLGLALWLLAAVTWVALPSVRRLAF